MIGEKLLAVPVLYMRRRVVDYRGIQARYRNVSQTEVVWSVIGSSGMNIRLMKKLDACIGYISASTFPSPVRRELSPPVTSLLLIRPGGIGDAVLLAPAINYLKKTYPAIYITVLAEQRNAGVFPLIPGVDRLLCYDRPGELIQALRSSYDVVIDTEQWHRLSAVVGP